MSSSELRRMEEGGGEGEGGSVGEGGGESGELKEMYYPRRNGWNWPWHPLQVLAWAFIVFFTTTYFGFLVFYIPGAWRSIGYIVAGVLLVTHLLSSLVTSIMDPADRSVRHRRAGMEGGFLRAVFDRKKHKRVIENRYCNLCEVHVSDSAKHCSVCDKCVKGFDHHCIWLNTCIGSRNYRWFLVAAFSALMACILLLVFTLSLFVTFFSDRGALRYACSDHFLSSNTSCSGRVRVFGAEVPDPVFPSLVAAIGLLALVGVAMIGYLATFHMYLMIKGMTTYDYILWQRQLKREREEAEEEEGVADQEPHGRCWFLRRKINRVNPSGSEGAEKGQGSQESGLDDIVSKSSSISSVGLVNFGRTPVQSVVGSSVGDVSLDSTGASSPPRQPLATDQAGGGTIGKNLHKLNHQQHVAIEMESLSQPMGAVYPDVVCQCDTTRTDRGTAATGGRKLGKATEKSCDHDLESCGILAYMNSSNSIELHRHESREREESDKNDLENCGTLVFMSSANSIPSRTVPTGTPITCDISDSATTTAAVCADTTVERSHCYEMATTQNDTLINFSRTADESLDGVRGGVTPSVSTESNKLREKTYEKMTRSGKTAGFKALRELASLSHETSSSAAAEQSGATTIVGFSNPLSRDERCSHLISEGFTQEQPRPTHTAEEYFPPPVQVSLTAQPMVCEHKSSTLTSL